MIHKNISIGRCTNSSHGTAFILYIYFTVEHEVLRINDRKVVITFVTIVFLGKL